MRDLSTFAAVLMVLLIVALGLYLISLIHAYPSEVKPIKITLCNGTTIQDTRCVLPMFRSVLSCDNGTYGCFLEAKP
jgi:hypothetical protein